MGFDLIGHKRKGVSEEIARGLRSHYTVGEWGMLGEALEFVGADLSEFSGYNHLAVSEAAALAWADALETGIDEIAEHFGLNEYQRQVVLDFVLWCQVATDGGFWQG